VTATTLTGRTLSKRYGDSEVVHAIDLEVHPAEVVGLLGPNGAGKTTTFNMLAGGGRPSASHSACTSLNDRPAPVRPL
jgi:sodium transport system ATP-binding protein